jgi:outer membrane lipoprotein SlyB
MSSQQGKPDQNKAITAGISGAILGGISGALIGASFSGADGALIGALAGALYMGITEAVTDLRRQPGELKPLWHRLISAPPWWERH